jgi:hypothetical protein
MEQELTWIQRAHTNRLKHGDRNSIFSIIMHLAGGEEIILRAWLMTMGQGMKMATLCGL